MHGCVFLIVTRLFYVLVLLMFLIFLTFFFLSAIIHFVFFFLEVSLRDGRYLFVICGLAKSDTPCRGRNVLLLLTCLWQIVCMK